MHVSSSRSPESPKLPAATPCCHGTWLRTLPWGRKRGGQRRAGEKGRPCGPLLLLLVSLCCSLEREALMYWSDDTDDTDTDELIIFRQLLLCHVAIHTREANNRLLFRMGAELWARGRPTKAAVAARVCVCVRPAEPARMGQPLEKSKGSLFLALQLWTAVLMQLPLPRSGSPMCWGRVWTC